MKILYLIDELETNYPRDQNYIIKFMMERGHEVEVITGRDYRFEAYDEFFFSHAKVLRGPFIFRIRKAKVYFHPKLLEKLYRVHEVVHSFTFFTFSSVLAPLFRSNVKIIRSEIGPPNGLNFTKAKHGIYQHLVKLYGSVYDYFTVYNQVERESIELLGIPRNRIVILPPMVDSLRFAKLRRKQENKDDFISIGIIGRISPEKGMHRLISIFEYIAKNFPRYQHKLRVVLAGRHDDKEYAKRILISLMKILGQNFIYIGEVAPPYRFYEKVDIVIVPSIIETGAITVIEAMAAGKCVIASNIYPINLYILDGRNGFLFNTPAEASKIIIDILSRSVDIESISREAQEYARKHDYVLVCKTLERLYKG